MTNKKTYYDFESECDEIDETMKKKGEEKLKKLYPEYNPKYDSFIQSELKKLRKYAKLEIEDDDFWIINQSVCGIVERILFKENKIKKKIKRRLKK